MQNKGVNILILVLSQGVNTVLGFLFTPYLVRALPKEVFGTYSQVMLMAEFAGILTSFAILQVSMMVFSNKERNLNDSIVTLVTTGLWAGLGGMILMLIFSYLAPQIFSNEMLGPFLRYFSIGLIANKLSTLLNQALIRIEKTKVILLLSTTTNFIKLSLGLVAIHYYNSVEMLLIVYACEPIINSIIQALILFKAKYLNGKFDRLIFNEMFKIALPLYFVEVLGTSYTYIAGFVISINLNEEQYAIYKNGSVELPVIGTIYGTVSLIFLSDILGHIQKSEFLEVAKIKKKIITATAIVLFPLAIFFAIFSKEFIEIYLSAKYIDSYSVFIVFCMALLIRFQNYTDVLIAMKKSKFVLYSFIVFMISNVVLNIILSKFLGILGCAVATIASVYILAFLQMHITIRELGVRYKDYLNIPDLLKIIFFSALLIGLLKLGFIYANQPPIIAFVASGLISIPTLLAFFIKLKFVDIKPFEHLFHKIPYFGKKIYSLLQ